MVGNLEEVVVNPFARVSNSILMVLESAGGCCEYISNAMESLEGCCEDIGTCFHWNINGFGISRRLL